MPRWPASSDGDTRTERSCVPASTVMRPITSSTMTSPRRRSTMANSGTADVTGGGRCKSYAGEAKRGDGSETGHASAESVYLGGQRIGYLGQDLAEQGLLESVLGAEKRGDLVT